MAKRGLGELESEVLSVLWSADGALTPAEVLERVNGDLAYTTVMTILTRMWQKGRLGRRHRGRAFEYSPQQTEAEYGAAQLVETLSKIDDRKAALSRFVGRLSAAELRELRAAIDKRGPRR